MARGWESKSVESQIEDQRQVPVERGSDAEREQLGRTRQRESIESTRRGILRDLESTKSDLRRRSLEAALKHLDEELRKF